MAKSNAFNMDCMEAMAEMPDKAFDLAIVDPPYGIGNFIPQAGQQQGKKFQAVTWNDTVPSDEYFAELKRIARHRIIWGANYYNCFDDLGGAIVWDKDQHNPKMSRCEIASHSFYKKIDYFRYTWNGIALGQREAFHPCQKPVALYKWLLQNYAKDGDTILDTHLGSGSSRIAAYDLGFDFTGYELDKDYFDAQERRFTDHASQARLFIPESSPIIQISMFKEPSNVV